MAETLPDGRGSVTGGAVEAIETWENHRGDGDGVRGLAVDSDGDFHFAATAQAGKGAGRKGPKSPLRDRGPLIPPVLRAVIDVQNFDGFSFH